jgi:hypothetical protein
MRSNHPHSQRTTEERWRRHSCRRARERYGLRLSQNDLAFIKRIIVSGNSALIERQGKHKSLYCVIFHGVNLYPVYNRQREEIITFLPDDHRAVIKYYERIIS